MLEVRSLSRSFSGVKALDAVDFKVEAGSITSLIGPNGAGKTTLINLVSGVVMPSSGDVLFCGESIVRKRPNQRATLGIRRTFQTVHLFAGLSVRENLTVGRFHTMAHSNWLFALLPQQTGDAAGCLLAEQTLDLLGLSHLADTLATTLPYGTQRRVEIARALMGRPKFLLLDEPAAGMNDTETEELRDEIRRIRDSGVTVFLVEHDMSLVMAVSDHVVVFDFGKKIAEGTPAVVQKNPDVIASYLA